MKKLEFITAYVLSSVSGFAHGKGNIDVNETLDDAEHFYNEIMKRFDVERVVKKKEE